MMDGFPENPLDSSESQIRLLRIPPLHQQTNTISSFFPSLSWIKDHILFSTSPHPISCTMETKSLSSHPEYLALAYTSGNPTPSTQVLINNKPIPITETLHTALQHIQRETKTTTIWIDALCTNHIPDNEKVTQATQTKIYQEADIVLVWLGPADDNSDELIELLSRIGRACDNLELPVITTKTLHELSQRPDDSYTRDVTYELEQLYQQFDYLFPDLFPFEAYRAFLARPWWRRSDSAQELAVANDVTFCCGKKGILYKHLCKVHTFLRGYCWSEMGRRKFVDEPFEEECTKAFEAVMNVATKWR